MLVFVLCVVFVLLLVSLVYLFKAAYYNRELQRSLDRLECILAGVAGVFSYGSSRSR